MPTNRRGVFLYHFSDFSTVQELPDVITIPELAKAIGLSQARTYKLMDERMLPHIRIQKRIIIFKEHLIQSMSNKEIFTDVAKLNALASLPEVFPPNRLMAAFRISHGFAYTLVHLPGFPAVMERDRIIVSKQGLIRWIQSNEKYIGKEK